MAGTDNTAVPPRTRTWVRVALVASLALNVLILGVVGGAVLNKGRDHPPRTAFAPGEYGPYGRALADTDRAALRAALKAEAPRLRENRAAVRQGFRDLLAALRAEPYEHARVVAVVQAQQARVQDQAALVQSLTLDRVGAMSGADRAAFADRLERVLRRGPPRGGDGERGTGRP
ncbi:periplasmic heavy metal sensor [Rhodovulum euryhalinum]|uniref:Putative membrane protein n=1 Tax=Rhodovulum euryhalinum TaxID=35805 RepID=A0A4R2KJB8_9RHOB|nr:periplasmic heavy metal sensor [Rhodovulum euryhalinum]TCO73981.1 putative membrane protein [Rhodovulum euryhalinum]